MRGLDWSDPLAVARWGAGRRVAFADADAVACDMLRAPRRRELGPVLAAQKYNAAREQILAALDFAAVPENDTGGPSDPAGSGGAGSVH